MAWGSEDVALLLSGDRLFVRSGRGVSRRSMRRPGCCVPGLPSSQNTLRLVKVFYIDLSSSLIDRITTLNTFNFILHQSLLSDLLLSFCTTLLQHALEMNNPAVNANQVPWDQQTLYLAATNRQVAPGGRTTYGQSQRLKLTMKCIKLTLSSAIAKGTLHEPGLHFLHRWVNALVQRPGASD